MNRMWSENRYVDLTVNVLLFLTGVNFMHYGQLILPVICFILFLDRRCRFHVHDPKIFILLCLFAVSFYGFSYALGFYSVMGFCCPMAYYIGSNLLNHKEDTIRKAIYLLAAAMACHILLNVGYEIVFRGIDRFLNSSSHYDFWTREKVSTTATAVNLDLLIGCLYHLLLHEKNPAAKFFCYFFFVLDILYCVILGRRTQILLLLICFVCLFFFELLFTGELSGRVKRNLLRIVLGLSVFIAAVVLCYAFDLLGLNHLFNNIYIIDKFRQGIIDHDRLSLFINGIKLMPQHLWGGQEISGILGVQIHDLWMDIYDYAGIVSYVLFLIYSLHCLRIMVRTVRDKSLQYRTLYLGVFICVTLQMFLEPVMSGSSLFLMIVILVFGMLEGIVNHEG